MVFYGTLEGYLVAVDADNGDDLYRFKTPSGIIGNTNTWVHDGKQYVGILSGVGGWAGIGMAAGLEGDTDGLGAVGAYRGLSKHTQLGGVLTVFALPVECMTGGRWPPRPPTAGMFIDRLRPRVTAGVAAGTI